MKSQRLFFSSLLFSINVVLFLDGNVSFDCNVITVLGGVRMKKAQQQIEI